MARLNKPEHVWFARGFGKTINSKPQTHVWVCSGRNPEQSCTNLTTLNTPEISLSNNPEHVPIPFAMRTMTGASFYLQFL